MHKLRKVQVRVWRGAAVSGAPTSQPFRMCRASKRGEGQPDIICAGLAQKSTSKAEDVCAVTITNEVSIAAVFDAHGGKIATERCNNELVPTLLEVAHSDSSDDAILDAFWDMDERLGLDGDEDWSITAVFDGHGGKIAAERCKNELVPILLEIAHSDSSAIDDAAIVDACWDMDKRIGMDGIDDGTTADVLLVRQKKEKLEGLVAWAGDSTALRVDMTAQAAAGAHLPGSTTANHVPDNKSEDED